MLRPKPDRRTFVMAKGGNKRDFGEHATKVGNKRDFGEHATKSGYRRDFGWKQPFLLPIPHTPPFHAPYARYLSRFRNPST